MVRFDLPPALPIEPPHHQGSEELGYYAPTFDRPVPVPRATLAQD